MNTKAQDLLEKLQARINAAPVARPKLRIVPREAIGTVTNGLDAASRAIMVARIRDLARMYWLAWLVRQETAAVGGIVECLEDDDLSALLQKMERGRECRVDGVAFDDAGLVSPNKTDAYHAID